MQQPLRWNDLVVEPGQLAKSHLRLLQLSDGRPLTAPVMIAHGREPGPTVFIGAGIHGDEINGVQTAIKTIRALDLNKLQGTVVCMPVQNPVAYRNRRRLLTFGRNEQDRKLNMHQAFPGDPAGEPAERAVHRILNEVIEQLACDFVFDLHTGTSIFFCAPHSFVPPSTLGEASSKAAKAAAALDLGLMVQASEGVYAAPDMPHMVLGERGIPVLGMELGAGGRYERDIVDRAVRGMLGALHTLGLLPGEPPAAKAQTKLGDVVWVRADQGGLLRPKVQLGDRVSAGQVLGEVLDLFGETSHQIITPVAGHIISLLGIPTVNEGEPIARIGVPA